MDIRKPQMILFDFGGTLFDDGPFDARAGLDALRKAALNPGAASIETLLSLWDKLIKEYSGTKSRSGWPIEIPITATLRNITLRAGLKYNLPPLEQELIFDRFNSTREPTPGISDLLDKCREKDIHTAVISNNGMSSEGLAISILEGLPESDMEFVISSADYILCKPAPDMFEAAVKTAGLAPEDCWYCGNDSHCDVLGALAGGMTPVFYDRRSAVPVETRKTPDGNEYIAVNHWSALGDLLDRL